MIECNTFVDANAHKEITKNACLAALIQLIAGVTGLATYIVLGTLFDEPWTIVFFNILPSVCQRVGVVYLHQKKPKISPEYCNRKQVSI